MQKLRVGIIGAGRIGQVHAKSITYHIPQAEIVAISDLFPENAQKVADDLGIPKAVQDYHEILNDPTVDAVLICSSTDTHADIAVEAAKAGKDIWCEKPMTRTIGEGKRVVEAVRQNGRIFRLNTWFRFQDTFYGLGTTVQPLKKLVDSSALTAGTTTTLLPLKIWQTPARSASSRPLRSLHATRSRPRFLM